MKRLGISITALALATTLGVTSPRAQAPYLSPVPTDMPPPGPATPGQRGTYGPFSLEDTLALAKKNNHGIAAEKAKLAQAQTNIETAWSALFPTVALQGKYTRNYKEVSFPSFTGMGFLLLQPLNQLDGSVSASMPILAPAAWAGLSAVKAGVASSDANYQVTQADVLVAVARAFLAAAVSDEVLAARVSAISVASATLKNAQTRQQAGTVTKVDVDRAELALVRAEQSEREAKFGREQAYRALGTLIGVDGTFTINPEFPTAPAPNPNDLEMALRLRPEFRSIDMSIKAAVSTARARYLQWAPTLSIFGNARKFNYDNFALDRHSWAAGAQLDWILYDGGRRDADRHAAEAQANEAQARALSLRDQIRDDLANSSSQLATKKKGIEAASRSVELARETLELVRVQYESGVGTQLDLLAAQDSVVVAHLGLAQAHFDAAAADLALRHAAGTFPPK